MYWGQIAVAVSVALSAAYWLTQEGYALATVTLISIVTYIGIRWLLAWIYRTRYWYHRGTRGFYSTTCPKCSQYIYRRSDSWILRCGRCGWTAGWPVLRWVTQSVPARQFRRTVVGPNLLIVVLAIGLVASGATAGVGLDDATDAIETPNDPIEVEQETPTNTDTIGSNRQIPAEEAERLIIKRTNEVRSQRGLGNVSQSEVPSEMAEGHSQDMADYDYYSHAGPNQSEESRIRGMSDRCGGPTSENIHRAPKVNGVRVYGGSETVDIFTADGIATYGVRGWMNSPGHRENMLDSRWTRVGVGVVETEDTVFMTIVFC